MISINPYLNFPGTAEEAFNYYKSLFNGEILVLQRFSDTAEKDRLQESEQNKIMHISLSLGNGVILMATDALESMGKKLTQGDHIHLSINASSKEEADKIYNGLAHGGTATMPISDTFWGAYFGMCTDQFGINWMVNYDYPKVG